MKAGKPLLELNGVSKDYGDVGVLRDVNLRLDGAEAIAIAGPSGSGKSTLLNIIGTLDRPTSGTVFFEGDDLLRLSADEIATMRNRKIGFVFQLHHLLPQCTILENVLIPTLAAAAKGRNDEANSRAQRLLDRVGLGAHKSQRPGQLSGGERQRAAVVRALINQPRLLLADEPTGSLDRASAENLRELLIQLNRDEGVALIVVTHSMELARGLDRIYEMRDGSLVEAKL
ncbi:MAG TPA: ABC transporter ATP-binding protein [Terrimicrobiaceae bacterium]